MPRRARIVAVGYPHHITQRGNNRRPVFYSDQDRALYLDLLQEYSSKFKLAIEGYCLMSNHVHLVAVPHRDDSLARALGRAHNDYARLIHIRRRESGHLWQNRFFSCPLDGYHLWQAMRYVELNPVRAAMVDGAGEWPWSSAGYHLGQVAAHPVISSGLWEASWTPQRWEEALSLGLGSQALLDQIREATRAGNPLGSDHFRQDLEHLLQRPITPQKRGRKPAASAGIVEAAAQLGIA